MSDLQKSFAKAHLSKLPPEPRPVVFDEGEEDDAVDELPPKSPNDSSSSASSVDSTDTVIPSPRRNLFERPKGSATRSRAGPLPWTDFFAQELFFDNPFTPGLRHHAYYTPPSANGPLIVTHHGAGSSGLSFATFFQSLMPLLPTAGILSLDCRGHGLTTCPEPLDLTLPTLASDLAFVLQSTITTQLPHLTTPPPILLIGHSLGGAIITHAAHTNLLQPPPQAVTILDVVEGSAIDALSSMESYLSTRPTKFPTISSAIDWHIRSRTLRNTQSARVSVPPLLKPTSTSTPITTPEPNASTTTDSTASAIPPAYTWVTNLSSTKPFWPLWFLDLSAHFLSLPSAKLLILAGTDRLDKILMIGQMQGKYQLQVFPDAGHFVHEDQPAKTAGVVADFWRRNDRGVLVLPKKVGELIKEGVVKGGGH